MTEQSPARSTDSDDPRVAVLQAVVDRVTSWQEGADATTVRQELDDALGQTDVEVDEDVRERIVAKIVDDGAHFDVTQVLS